MYKVGNLPDHVTRYNHKCTDRWMVPPAKRRIDLRAVTDAILLGISAAGIIISAVMAMGVVA